jgi:hypothetical protein
MKLLSLVPFPGLHESHARSFKISAGASISLGELTLQYRIEASTPEALSSVILPNPQEKVMRRDELWKETCFEAFIPHLESDSYLEFNGSPSGDWNCYSFRQYREGMNPIPVNGASLPKLLSLTKSSKVIEVQWSVPMASLKQGFFALGIGAIELAPLGLTLVLNTSLATTYWALKHDGVKPDFHMRSSFIYDSIRD